MWIAAGSGTACTTQFKRYGHNAALPHPAQDVGFAAGCICPAFQGEQAPNTGKLARKTACQPGVRLSVQGTRLRIVAPNYLDGEDSVVGHG